MKHGRQQCAAVVVVRDVPRTCVVINDSCSFETLGIGLSNSFIYGVDVWLIGVIYTPTEVGIYNGAKAVWRVLSSVNQAVGLLVLPFTAKLKSENNLVRLRELYEKVIAYSWIGLVVAATVGIIFAERFYSIFLGGRYMGSVIILQIMLLGAPFEGLFNVAGNILYGLGKAREVAKVSLQGVFILLLVLFPAVYFFEGIGASAVLSSTLLYIGLNIFRKVSVELDTNLKSIASRFSRNMRSLIASGVK